MAILNYEELILLDNFIYLEWQAKQNDFLIDIIDEILKLENLDNLINKPNTCLLKMPKEEWLYILEKMKSKENLRNLKIFDLKNDKDGFRAACFADELNNITVVFRGSSSKEEWDDNGQGAYEYDTTEQLEALLYIESLKFYNITVTGHSKGGNKAQYVTILSPKVERCISVNAQGFSNEFIEKYKIEIKNNREKIICINAKYDYVSCLLNTITNNVNYIKTEIQINPLFYHKCNILLDDYGNLRDTCERTFFSKIINDFSTSIISDLPKELRTLVIEGLMGVVERFLCKDPINENIIKIAGGILIILMYGKYFKYKEAFAISYSILEMLIIPVLLWNDFIEVDKTDSNEKYKKLINRITFMEKSVLDRLNILDEKTNNLNLLENTKNKKILSNIKKALNRFTKNLYEEELNMK